LIANGVVSSEYSGEAELALPARFTLSGVASRARLTGGTRDNTRDAFSSTLGWGRILGLLFPRGLMLLDFDEHRLHRRALSVAFKSGPMKSYLAELDTGIAARVAQWKAQPGPMLFYPAMKQLTLDLAATSFLGAGIGPEIAVTPAA